MSELTQAEKEEMVREAQHSALARPADSNIRQAQPTRGTGRNPDSNIKEAEVTRGLHRSTNEVRAGKKPIEPFHNNPGEEGGAGTPYEHPFILKSATTPEGDPAWMVGGFGSSIRNGTNGANLAITGLNEAKTDVGKVYACVAINPDLTIIGTTIQAEAETKEEVDFADSDPPEQAFAWLYIGTVSLVNEVFVLDQALNTAQVLVNGFLNATLCKVFASCPSHPDSLVV